jgi:hypothetical protein
MVIPVKELLQLSKDHGNGPLSFYYNAQGHSEGRALASFQVGGKTTASLIKGRAFLRKTLSIGVTPS